MEFRCHVFPSKQKRKREQERWNCRCWFIAVTWVHQWTSILCIFKWICGTSMYNNQWVTDWYAKRQGKYRTALFSIKGWNNQFTLMILLLHSGALRNFYPNRNWMNCKPPFYQGVQGIVLLEECKFPGSQKE